MFSFGEVALAESIDYQLRNQVQVHRCLQFPELFPVSLT